MGLTEHEYGQPKYHLSSDLEANGAESIYFQIFAKKSIFAACRRGLDPDKFLRIEEICLRDNKMRLVEVRGFYTETTKKDAKALRGRQDAWLAKRRKADEEKAALAAMDIEEMDPVDFIDRGNRLKATQFELCRTELRILRDHIAWLPSAEIDRRAAARGAKEAWDAEIEACKARLIKSEGYAPAGSTGPDGDRCLIPAMWNLSPRVQEKVIAFNKLNQSQDATELKKAAEFCERRLEEFRREFSAIQTAATGKPPAAGASLADLG